jgi:hypothetical protein
MSRCAVCVISSPCSTGAGAPAAADGARRVLGADSGAILGLAGVVGRVTSVGGCGRVVGVAAGVLAMVSGALAVAKVLVGLVVGAWFESTVAQPASSVRISAPIMRLDALKALKSSGPPPLVRRRGLDGLRPPNLLKWGGVACSRPQQNLRGEPLILSVVLFIRIRPGDSIDAAADAERYP